MAKYSINHTCGHTSTTDLFGKGSDRERKIEWLETTLCPECQKAAKIAKMQETHDVVEMHYGEYKNNYSNNETVPGSYNADTKTIQFFVEKPIAEETEEETKEETTEEGENNMTATYNNEPVTILYQNQPQLTAGIGVHNKLDGRFLAIQDAYGDITCIQYTDVECRGENVYTINHIARRFVLSDLTAHGCKIPADWNEPVKLRFGMEKPIGELFAHGGSWNCPCYTTVTRVRFYADAKTAYWMIGEDIAI